MMIHEFTERTGYEPTMEEYRFIEESYYDFDGQKDEFCKAWLKDKRNGSWEKELRFRKMLEEQKESFEKKLSEKEETISFYRPYFDRTRELSKQLEEANKKLERLERVFHRVFDQQEG